MRIQQGDAAPGPIDPAHVRIDAIRAVDPDGVPRSGRDAIDDGNATIGQGHGVAVAIDLVRVAEQHEARPALVDALADDAVDAFRRAEVAAVGLWTTRRDSDDDRIDLQLLRPTVEREGVLVLAHDD